MRNSTRQHHLQLDEAFLALLSLVAGPVLLWMAGVWQGRTAAASGAVTLESWIALACAGIGVVLSVVWIVFLVSGLTYAFALKTRSALMLRWSRLMTPRFLRRMILSLLGLQIAMSSQAFAAVETLPPEPAPSSQVTEDAFMPEIQLPDTTSQPTQNHPAHTLENPEMSATASAQPGGPDSTHRTVEPRITSKLPVDNTALDDVTATASPSLTPTPRQVSTIDLEQHPEFSDAPSGVSATDQAYTPPAQPLAPYLTPTPDQPATERTTVVVTRGDCLWDIAHEELGAEASVFQIDRRWRQWWEYNYQLIGDDPHTILPGTELTAPPFTS